MVKDKIMNWAPNNVRLKSDVMTLFLVNNSAFLSREIQQVLQLERNFKTMTSK